jgi:hypothetical protein
MELVYAELALSLSKSQIGEKGSGGYIMIWPWYVVVLPYLDMSADHRMRSWL